MKGWKYKQPIKITNNANQNLVHVDLIINTAELISAGKMKPDGGDIRFQDENKNNLPYFIEGGINTTNTLIKIKIPPLPPNNSKFVYLFYGNPNANSESNPDNVYYFYDHFEGTTLDNNKWDLTPEGPYDSLVYSISNSFLIPYNRPTDPWKQAHSRNYRINPNVPQVIEVRENWVGLPYSRFGFDVNLDGGDGWGLRITVNASYNQMGFNELINWNWYSTFTSYVSGFKRNQIFIMGNNNYRCRILDDNYNTIFDSNVFSVPEYSDKIFKFYIQVKQSENAEVSYDYVKIFNFIDALPTIQFFPEQPVIQKKSSFIYFLEK